MAKLSRAEIDAKYTPAMGAEIAGLYKAQAARRICVCGRDVGKSDPACACGLADAHELQNHNQAVQATRTLMHRRLRDFFKITGEEAWSLVDGSTEDEGHQPALGFVHRAGFIHDHELEQKLRDDHAAALANLGKVLT